MARRNPPDSGTASLVESYPQPPGRTTLDAIAAIPEEHVWLASRRYDGLSRHPVKKGRVKYIGTTRVTAA